LTRSTITCVTITVVTKLKMTKPRLCVGFVGVAGIYPGVGDVSAAVAVHAASAGDDDEESGDCDGNCVVISKPLE